MSTSLDHRLPSLVTAIVHRSCAAAAADAAAAAAVVAVVLAVVVAVIVRRKMTTRRRLVVWRGLLLPKAHPNVRITAKR